MIIPLRLMLLGTKVHVLFCLGSPSLAALLLCLKQPLHAQATAGVAAWCGRFLPCYSCTRRCCPSIRVQKHLQSPAAAAAT
jgi:hypothetical protein